MPAGILVKGLIDQIFESWIVFSGLQYDHDIKKQGKSAVDMLTYDGERRIEGNSSIGVHREGYETTKN